MGGGDERSEISVVGPGTRIEGTVVAAGSLRVEGEVKGKITAEGEVRLSPQGRGDDPSSDGPGSRRIDEHARRLATHLVDRVAELGWRPFRPLSNPSAVQAPPILIEGATHPIP